MRIWTLISATAGMFAAGLLVACTADVTPKPAGTATPGATTPAAETAEVAAGNDVTLETSGATFPKPLYDKWFAEFHAKHDNVQVNNAGGGSSAGIKQFIEGTTDIGFSDAAMKPEEMAKVEGGVVLLPMTAGHVVLSYNLDGVKDLKLTREAYSKIFLGEITKWNDPIIAKANEGTKLPDLAITPVVRAEGSGTSFVFSSHLVAVSDKFSELWKGKGSKEPLFPGNPNKQSGNDGVANAIKTTAGAIGYVEYGYAAQNNLAMAHLENKAGKMTAPTPEAASKALANVELPDDMIAWANDPAGDESYPIVTYTWWLCRKQYDDPDVSATAKALATWCLTDGQKFSADLGYIPLPKEVTDRVIEVATNQIKP